MAKVISTLFKDAVAKTKSGASDMSGVKLRDSDLEGIPEVIGVDIGAGESNDLFEFIDSLD